MKKIIVAHPNRQHSFRLATALKEKNMLFKYITTVYDKESSLMMKLTKKIIKGDNLKRANGRKCDLLNDEDIIQFYEIRGLIELLLGRIDKSQKIYKWWRRQTFDLFGRKVAKYAIKHNVDAVIMYDTTSEKCFEILKKKAPHIKRIMDSSIANRLYIKEIYQNEINKDQCKYDLYYSDDLWNKKRNKSYFNELTYTQYFLVPSKFVRDSFLFSGVKKEQICIVPYGANILIDSVIEKRVNSNDIINFLFVGQVTSRKGINYLIDAFESIKYRNVQLNIVGNIENDMKEFIKKSNKLNINFLGCVTHDKMKEIYMNAHVFVFPSLAEGMTLAGLEAMGCGLPIICTENTGVNDIVRNGENGFVIPASDSQQLKEKIEWFVEHYDQISIMGYNAYNTAKMYTWDNYNLNIIDAIKNIIDK